jgi:hypothetical protein
MLPLKKLQSQASVFMYQRRILIFSRREVLYDEFNGKLL